MLPDQGARAGVQFVMIICKFHQFKDTMIDESVQAYM